jgi:hypothetical protein
MHDFDQAQSQKESFVASRTKNSLGKVRFAHLRSLAIERIFGKSTAATAAASTAGDLRGESAAEASSSEKESDGDDDESETGSEGSESSSLSSHDSHRRDSSKRQKTRRTGGSRRSEPESRCSRNMRELPRDGVASCRQRKRHIDFSGASDR